MSDGPPRISRDLATLFGRRGFFQTCRWRCGWQCFGETANTSNNEPFSGVLGEAISRRGLLRGALASAAMLVISDLPVAANVPAGVRESDTLLLGFQPIATSTEDRIVVPDGYTHNVVIRWGDPVLPGAPAFDVRQQSPQAQARQFGYNADFVAFFPLPAGYRTNPRVAADLLGATKMDRPEDIEADPVGGGVYMVMTNNTRRMPTQVDAANPRPNNRHGHILEVMEDGRDPLATSFRWQIFMLCGDPKSAEDRAYFAGFPPDRVSAISTPDNITFDRRGNMWIATDGQPGTVRRNDGVFMMPTGGPLRGYLRQFLSAPRAAEVCGPELTPDNRALFVAIQHPGEGGTLEKPMSTWPDGQPVPRPAVIAVWHRERQIIGA